MIFRLLALGLLGLVASVVQKTQHAGLDFYHFWVVGAALDRTETNLGSPYVEADQYAAILNAEADQIWLRFINQEQLRDLEGNNELAAMAIDRSAAQYGEEQVVELRENSQFLTINLRRRALDLTGTPLLYALCTWLPSNYAAAYQLWIWLLTTAFLASAFLILRPFARSAEEALCWAAALAMMMRPLFIDTAVGNMNSLHLFIASLALVIAVGPMRRANQLAARERWGACALALTALFVLIKPTFAVAGLALVGHVGIALGRQSFRRALVPAGMFSAFLFLLPCILLGAWGIWFDWLGFIGHDAERLAYGIEKGNISMPLYLATWFPSIPLAAWSLVVMTALFGSLFLVASRGEASSIGERLRINARRLFSDPLAAMTMGICVTLATSPLVWGHYLTILLFPLGWMLNWEPEFKQTKRAWICGLLAIPSILLYSGTIQVLLETIGMEDPVFLLRHWASCAWIPFWILGLFWLRSRTQAEVSTNTVASLETAPA